MAAAASDIMDCLSSDSGMRIAVKTLPLYPDPGRDRVEKRRD
jgi:hypothetical protein